jgi:uncharacterized membrane protein YfcA
MCTPAGISGAFLLLPVQVQVLNVPNPTVSATNLLYNVISAPAGSVSFHRSGRLDRDLAVALCLGTTPGVVVGVLLRCTWLSDPDRFGIIAGVMLVGLGLRTLVDVLRPQGMVPARADLPPVWRLVTMGAVTGLLGGIYGIGGAAIVVPWLTSVERVPVGRVAGAGLVATFVTSVVGLGTFALAEVVGIGDADAPQWFNGLALGIGGMLGATAGARIQPRVPVRLLRILIGVAAVVAGLRM